MSGFAELYYKRAILPYLLLPFAAIYAAIIFLRKKFYDIGWFKSYKAPVPVIIVGNITLGGTGKTPLVIALVNYLKSQGFNPGIVSRGYGSKAPSYPFIINDNALPTQCGDEPLLIYRATKAPVVIDADRPRACETLLKEFPCDVIISDDGLQHYALKRDIEIIVLDGERGFGNGFIFPAGPLRESKKRLRKADLVVCNGKLLYKNSYLMNFKPKAIHNLKSGKIVEADYFKDKKLIAVAGIGNPSRFFQTLKELSLKFSKQPMPDHYQFSENDFADKDSFYLMTEKDAVKCQSFAKENMFYLPIEAELEQQFYEEIEILLNKCSCAPSEARRALGSIEKA